MSKFDLVYKNIMIRTSFMGTHNWPEASQFEGERINFLEYEHRHTFHIKASLSVNHSDREVEFFIFKDMINNIIEKLYPIAQHELVRRLGRKSCETIAEEIITELRHDFEKNDITIEVWEDNEVGALVVNKNSKEI